MKKLLIVTLCIVLALSFAACGKKALSEEDAARLEHAAENIASAGSVSYAMEKNGETLDIEYIASPYALKISGMSAVGLEIEGYAIPSGDHYLFCSRLDDEWKKSAVTEDDLAVYDAFKAMSLCLGVDGYALKGSENVNGKDATRYSAAVTGDAAGDFAAIVGGAEKATVDIWLDDGDMPIKYAIAADAGITVTINEYNTVGAISLPPEALAAPLE